MQLSTSDNTQKHIVPKLDRAIRIADFLPGVFPSITTKSAAKKALKKELITVDKKIATTATLLEGGEMLVLLNDILKAKKPILKLKLDVLFEDDFLAVVNKPAGITVSGNKHYTLENALAFNLKSSNEPDCLIAPEPAHRLDYPTSGLLLIAKTKSVLIELNKQFENKQVEKVYIAITIGNMSPEGTNKTSIEGKECLTVFKVLKVEESIRFKKLNLVQLEPKTGRKHQLRIHMTQNGNPILGDLEHGVEGLILKGKGLYLHAYKLSFKHPKTNQLISTETPVPGKFKKIFPEFKLRS